MLPHTPGGWGRIGLILDMLSILFASPEILGETRLIWLEDQVESGMRGMLSRFFRFFYAYAQSQSNRRARSAGRTPMKITTSDAEEALSQGDIEGGGGVEVLLPGRYLGEGGLSVFVHFWALFWGLVGVVLLSFLVRDFVRAIIARLGAGEIMPVLCFTPFLLGAITLLLFSLSVSGIFGIPMVLRPLIDNSHIRRRSLILGTILFGVAILLQLIGSSLTINRLGLVLDLAAFLLATPEVIQIKRLRQVSLRQQLGLSIFLFIAGAALQTMGQTGVINWIGMVLEFSGYWLALPEAISLPWIKERLYRPLLIAGAGVFAAGILLQLIASYGP